MPAAAVIPAPIAYIKIVAVKKLVVEFLHRRDTPTLWVGSVAVSAYSGVDIPHLIVTVSCLGPLL